MILCDIDGVLATDAGRDTAPGRPIYRTYCGWPSELDRIRDEGIPFHVVTAKVEPEARQLLEAVAVAPYVSSLIGADRLFWPTVWRALTDGRAPAFLRKSAYRRVINPPDSGRVVMIEDRSDNLRELLDAGAVDVGILVPELTSQHGRPTGWFNLESVLATARRAATGALDRDELEAQGARVCQWRTNAGSTQGSQPRYLIEIPQCPPGRGGPTSWEDLDTGRVLEAGPWGVVRTARAARRVLRRVKMGRGPE